ncbi:MAG TPA: Rieske 2Fe-2S domain-containing protein [Candidatus Limnocylindrales bacterium]|nr:Rieske 2Fe-2S domain-containing protein [Candidatus Limnocylindrales bacterium]
MISGEENDLLTQTNAGTPCGELLRRYWQPVALSEELKSDAVPVPVTLMGEELVLFRDEQGRVGLLERHCCHRGADLSYGRLEDGGMRCIYHGWLFDVNGTILEQPGEPNGGEQRHAYCQPSFPCREIGGIVLAYIGPGEPPLLPNYEFFQVPDNQRFVSKIHHSCNYLQSNEGNIDPVHLSFLHRNLELTETDKKRRVTGSECSPNSLFGADLAPRIELEITDFGVRIFTVRNIEDDKIYFRTSNFIMPNFSTFPGQTAAEGYSVNWHVPIDDHSHWKFVIVFSRKRALDRALMLRGRDELRADYHMIRSKANRYLQDRASMKNKSFSGIGYNFQAQDACVIEGAGTVQDRTKEHLVTSDKAIIAARKLLLKGIQDVKEGRDPLHVVRDPKQNQFRHIAVISEVAQQSADMRAIVNRKIGEQSSATSSISI